MMPTHQHLGYRRKPHHTPVAVVTKEAIEEDILSVLHTIYVVIIIIIKHGPQASQHHRASRELGPVLGLVWVRQHEAVPRHPVQRYFALPAVARQYTTSGGAAPFARRGFMCGSLRRDPSLLSASFHSDPGSRTALQSTACATSLSHDPVASLVRASPRTPSLSQTL